MPHAPKILVFDSGVGGLSVLAALRERLPGCNFVFACDNAAFPYGTKPDTELIDRVDRVVGTLVRRLVPDLVVIACNSASTLALPRLRQHLDLPIVGVVPAIKPAAQISATKVIGLLGTPATVRRGYTQQLIADFAAHCRVVALGSSTLVDIAEQALRGKPPDLGELQEILAPLFAVEQLDTLVLACTHFPLLTAELKAVAPRPLHWIDSGDAIARRVASLLPDWQPAVDTGFQTCFTSSANLGALYPTLVGLGCTGVEIRDADGVDHGPLADFPASAAN